MSGANLVRLQRTCEVIEIPSGRVSTLPEGTPVRIMQSRGDSYTVWTDYGQMYRVDGKDADALGCQAGSDEPAAADTREFNEQMVWDVLKTVYDPEIPVNIVDLGLIYTVKFDSAPDDKQDVSIDMTLTAQGCPEHVNISQQVKSRLEQLPGIRNAAVNVVWSPPWTPERLSQDAKKQLGIE